VPFLCQRRCILHTDLAVLVAAPNTHELPMPLPLGIAALLTTMIMLHSDKLPALADRRAQRLFPRFLPRKQLLQNLHVIHSCMTLETGIASFAAEGAVTAATPIRTAKITSLSSMVHNARYYFSTPESLNSDDVAERDRRLRKNRTS
jgi:hypothetical protein